MMALPRLSFRGSAPSTSSPSVRRLAIFLEVQLLRTRSLHKTVSQSFGTRIRSITPARDLVETHTALECQVGSIRRSLQSSASSVQTQVQDLTSSWIARERPLETRVRSLSASSPLHHWLGFLLTHIGPRVHPHRTKMLAHSDWPRFSEELLPPTIRLWSTLRSSSC
ncbi:unnamed protein product, partial [Tilletia laevis]